MVTAQLDAQILDALHQAFASCQRPEHFTNHKHCCECAEHDEVLRSRDLDSLRIEDVGNPGWDPICFISPEGFRYYMPALARLALEPLVDAHDWYGDQLIFHLRYDGPRNRRFLACTPEQRRAVAGFLRHLVETRAEMVDDYGCTDNLFEALEIWSESL